MGRLSRWLAAVAMAAALAFIGAQSVAAFDEFADSSATSTYGEGITFTVDYGGGAPDSIELLMRTPGSDTSFVAPVNPGADGSTYVWQTSVDYLTPNTLVTYRWRAVVDGEVVISEPSTIRYADDRPGLDWQSAQLGEATVHWYGGAEAQARRFGELTAVGVAQAEGLLGSELAGPVDVFVYESQADFFGALGPGVREWTGAAAYSEIRTIFMWLGGGSPAYLEQAMVHEVTHIVFHDATDNPFHEPARWLNEGFATWSETRSDAGEREIVEIEAAGDGLFAFDAITEQFPIGDLGARLSYSQGTSMVQLIVDRYGEGAIAAIMAAYRDGASDAEALEAGTGVPAQQLYADFYDEFGAEVPTPIAPVPIAASNVDRPQVGEVDPGGVDPGAAEEPPDEAAPGEEVPADGGSDLAFAIGLFISLVAVGGVALLVVRAGRGSDA
jgi:hypothetical protein